MSQVTSQNALVKDTTVQTLNGKLDNLNATLGGNANIAPVFNTATAYSKGDMVNYNGDLYVFTANHSAGAWTGSDAVQTKVSSELSSLRSGLTNLSSAFHEVAINESFVFGPQMGFVAWLGWGGKQIKGYIPIPNDAIYRGTYQAQIQSNEYLTVLVNGAVTNLDKTKISSIDVNPRNGAVIIVFSEPPVNNVDNTIVNVVTSFELTRTA